MRKAPPEPGALFGRLSADRIDGRQVPEHDARTISGGAVSALGRHTPGTAERDGKLGKENGMSVVCGLSATTFKPEIDKWVAMDCEGVVLWSGSGALIVLSYDGCRWLVHKHPQMDTQHSEAPPHECLRYRGLCYARQGQLVATLESEAPAAQWAELYARCHRL